MAAWGLRVVALLIIADAVFSNVTLTDVNNRLDVKAINDRLDKKLPLDKNAETRRKYKGNKHRSTSSSSDGRKTGSDGGSKESLDLSTSFSTSSEDNKKKHEDLKSTVERHGWRKWHRKCQQCPEDMAKKWRDPSIKWICGAYQRARRSFKSLCMMHYRNCQDGTMFTKIHDHRCQNSTGEELPHGDHFFYDYKADLSVDSSNTKSSSSQLTDSNSDDY